MLYKNIFLTEEEAKNCVKRFRELLLASYYLTKVNSVFSDYLILISMYSKINVIYIEDN